MAWAKIDDRLHNNYKSRKLLAQKRPDKKRDAAPMGLWVMAMSWCAQNDCDGWIPEEELDRFDDNWEELAARLVDAGFWEAEIRDVPGYTFHDWREWNYPQSSEAKALAGSYGNHVRWHVNAGRVDPNCAHCPAPPDDVPDDPIAVRSQCDIAESSHCDRTLRSQNVATPVPVPVPDPVPVPVNNYPSSPPPIPGAGWPASPDAEASCDGATVEGGIITDALIPPPAPAQPAPSRKHAQPADPDGWQAWYSLYPRKTGKGAALRAYRSALKKATPEQLLDALQQQLPAMVAQEPRFRPHPATWLNGERWLDETPTPMPSPIPIRKTGPGSRCLSGQAHELDWDYLLERARLKDEGLL